MSKCKHCGKSGLFLGINKNGFCKKCASIDDSLKKVGLRSLSQLDKETKLADSQIERLNEARSKYESTCDYESLIKVYESVFSEELHWNACSHKLRLADYYIKVGRNNNAWSLLNSMVIEYPTDISRIRKIQLKILKSEKRYNDALEMLFLYYFDHCKDMPRFDESYIEKFKNEAVKIAKKIEIEPECIDAITTVLRKCVTSSKCDEGIACRKFRECIDRNSI